MPRLIWQDKAIRGERLAPAQPAPLPLRALEIVDPNPFGGDDPLPFPGHAHPDKGWRNQLIRGDNKYIMASLLPDYAGQIDLIYIDPPFATGGDFSIRIPSPNGRRRREESALRKRAYRDRWEGGLDSYLLMMSERLTLMRELLADDGSIYVHLDWHAGHYVKILMDEIFGRENFRNEIVWCYRTMQTSKRGWAKKHDNILYYTKSGRYTFNLKEVLEPYPPDYQRRFRYTDDRGRRFMIRGKGGPFGFGQGDIRIEDEKRYPQFTYRQYIQEGSIPKDWWEIEMLNSNSQERVGFETQKPEALLERIIKASSHPGDLVADFFCGSGTALVVAERLGRRWMGADLSGHAIHTTRKRLLEIPRCRPFRLLDLPDSRKAKLKEAGIRNCRGFLLQLYRAQPLPGYRRLHGSKEGRMVHVGRMASAVSEKEVQETIRECVSAGAKALEILGWEFEPEVNDLAHRIATEHSITLRLVLIPREVLEVRDPAREEVRFLLLNRLEVGYRWKGRTLTLFLRDLVPPPPEELPKGAKAKATKMGNLIDYWAVDFDYQGRTFHSQWQSFRTRKHPRLETRCSHRYEKEGSYRVLVQVVDLFGNETRHLLKLSTMGD
ncbi:MAG: site-specific DNA-methyltransferase [candidate division NC10 bacterium]|nr:site-specific DNA-methyltransferase [candidate division NC10 bacterium]